MIPLATLRATEANKFDETVLTLDLYACDFCRIIYKTTYSR